MLAILTWLVLVQGLYYLRSYQSGKVLDVPVLILVLIPGMSLNTYQTNTGIWYLHPQAGADGVSEE